MRKKKYVEYEPEIPQHLLDHGYTEEEARKVMCLPYYTDPYSFKEYKNEPYDEENDYFELMDYTIRDSTGGLGKSDKRYK